MPNRECKAFDRGRVGFPILNCCERYLATFCVDLLREGLLCQRHFKEVLDNPYAKLIVYDPKRDFFAWLSSLGLGVPIDYFLPSDKRSVTLDFMLAAARKLSHFRRAS